MYILISEMNNFYSVKSVTKVNLTNKYKIILRSANQKQLKKIAHHLNFFVPYVKLHRIYTNFNLNATVNETTLNMQCLTKCGRIDDVDVNQTQYNADISEIIMDDDDYGNISGFGSLDEIKIDELSRIDEDFVDEIMNESMYHHNKSNLNILLHDINDLEKADISDNIEKNSETNLSPLLLINPEEILEPCTSCHADHPSNMYVVPSGTHKKRQDFCYYCNTMQQVISRHLEKMHKNEIDVKEFMILPKGGTERKKIIEKIRLNGNHKFNTNSKYNTGELLTRRHPNEKWTNNPNEYEVCENCYGYHTKSGIVKHRRRCLKKLSMNS